MTTGGPPLGVLCAAALIINVNNTILNVALPTLVLGERPVKVDRSALPDDERPHERLGEIGAIRLKVPKWSFVYEIVHCVHPVRPSGRALSW